MPYCPKCKNEVKKGARFCGNCGAPLPALCPKCGNEVKEGARFCGNCGAPLAAPVRYEEAKPKPPAPERGIPLKKSAAVVSIFVVIVVGAFIVAMRPGEGEGARPRVGPPGGGPPGEGIAGATSLSLKWECTAKGVTSSGTTMAKNIRSPNLKVRCEGTAAGELFKIIVDAGERKAWTWNPQMGWMEVPDFQPTLQQVETRMEACLEALRQWTGGELSYTDPTTGITLRLWDIEVNPDLPDPLFRPD